MKVAILNPFVGHKSQSMQSYTTNVFEFTNLEAINTNYTLYKIAASELTESDKNKIIRKLSFKLRHPITIISECLDGEDTDCLVVVDEFEKTEKIPQELRLGRAKKVFFEAINQSYKLDFKNPTIQTKRICLRVLNFNLQGHFRRFRELWQPSAGQAYFEKTPSNHGNNHVDVYRGFSSRVIELPNNSFGVCIDSTKRYVSKNPLDIYLNHRDFRKSEGRKFVYKFGDKWSEIRPQKVSGLKAIQTDYERGDKTISLYEDIKQQNQNPYTQNIPEDGAVLLYQRKGGDMSLAAAAGLCYQKYDTEDREIKQLHRKSILPPFIRLNDIIAIRKKYLNTLWYGSTQLKVSFKPISIDKEYFTIPDVEFGKNHILSVKGNEGVKYTTIDNLGKARLSAVENEDIGFFTTEETQLFSQQIFIAPESMNEVLLNYFLNDLKDKVDALFPEGGNYKPDLLWFNDQNPHNYLSVGLDIVNVVKDKFPNSIERPTIYCIVMLPNFNRGKRNHDKLASLVIAELQKINVKTTIVHTRTINKSLLSNGNRCLVDQSARGKYNGYIKNVALVKVLLNNEKYPYCLHTPLNADLIVGIDVKDYTAGFIFIDKNAKYIRQVLDKKGKHKEEKLRNRQIFTQLYKNVRELVDSGLEIKSICIHRDGNVFDVEIDDIMKAFQKLKDEKILPSDSSLTVLKILKSSPVSFRLFDKKQKYGKPYIENPNIGSYYFLNERTAFLCSTGREFLSSKMTANPLCVEYAYGDMPFGQALEDVFALTTLAFTKIDDCSRIPLSIKLIDMRLKAVASHYDEDKFERKIEETNIIEYEL